MAVNLPRIGKLHDVPGVTCGAVKANIRYQDRLDLAVILCDEGSLAGGVFTQSDFAAAPVSLARQRCGTVRGLVINSGNANAATGEQGVRDAEESCRLVASYLGASESDVLPFSTGVIGEFLPMTRMREAIDAACRDAGSARWNDVAQAIMTTDTQPKGESVKFLCSGTQIAATGIAKGSGMIRPDMATMLSFIATDASLSAEALQQLTKNLADCSFNRITVDGDTSTNDAFVIVATARAEMKRIDDTRSKAYEQLLEGLLPLAHNLAEMLVRDAEGATKFVTVEVNGGRTNAECRQVAYTIAHSPLVKTALFAGDPNWGRFCMAIGRAGLINLDTTQISLYLDDTVIARHGVVAPDYLESNAAAVMARSEFKVVVSLGRGRASDVVWTSDLSYDYVKINAEYRS